MGLSASRARRPYLFVARTSEVRATATSKLSVWFNSTSACCVSRQRNRAADLGGPRLHDHRATVRPGDGCARQTRDASGSANRCSSTVGQ